MAHPREVLLGAQARTGALPVCDHYSGVEARMRKSLQLQEEMTQEFGACVFDVTLDCEDGAPVGGEAEHAALVVELALNAKPDARVAVRVHPVDHPAFDSDIATIAGKAGHRLVHVMLPKVERPEDVERAARALDAAGARDLPLQGLIESPAAVHRAFDIAAHPRMQSLSFGLMDFVSAHQGAVPASAMTLQGQFEHPLVRRAKLEISAACHAAAKVPSHSVVTEFRHVKAIQQAAERAAHEFGYMRMWSIHPSQVQPIVETFAPTVAELDEAIEIINAGIVAQWAPIRHRDLLHDRASYRYYWQVIERARRTGQPLPAEAEQAWFGKATA